MDRDNEAHFGLTFPGVYALMAQRHMHQHGTTREQIASVAVKNHENAMHNPNAQFHRKITVDDVLKSPLVADPLRLLDCSPIADGAAALIIVPAEHAKKYTDTPIYIRASSQASDTLGLYTRPDVTTVGATINAAQNAYKYSGLGSKDMHLAEVHDCFTINEIIATEDLGFCKKGEGGRFIQSGETRIGGKIPINTSGGLKAKGHPVGATGAAQAVEIVEQLRGDAGGRQVKGAENGLAHNVGGSGSTVVVHIMSRNRK
jgi:acetyl-CoA C-acetyltransferase